MYACMYVYVCMYMNMQYYNKIITSIYKCIIKT